MRVAVINMKGGCSKTTLVVSVGFVAEEKGYPLCVFDNDLQRNAVNWLSGGIWNDTSMIRGIKSNLLLTVDKSEINTHPNLIVDCSPKFEQLGAILGINLDAVVVPIDGSMAMRGAWDIIPRICEMDSNIRIVSILTLANNGPVFGNDRVEMVKLGDRVEIYKHAIPNQNSVKVATQKNTAPWRGNSDVAGRRLREFGEWFFAGMPLSGTYSSDDKKDFAVGRIGYRAGEYGKWEV